MLIIKLEVLKLFFSSQAIYHKYHKNVKVNYKQLQMAVSLLIMAFCFN